MTETPEQPHIPGLPPTQAGRPPFPRFDLEALEFDYDDDSDTLTLTLSQGRPAVSIPLDDDDRMLLRFDRAANEIVGFMIEDFIGSFVLDHPELLEIAEFVGAEPTKIARARGQLSPERKKSAAARLLEPLFNAQPRLSVP
ncbi:MAG: DUF2283 domain-containing protein [Thermomicrobiales bacterium]